MTDRWVVLGLAPPRSEWFRRLASWATAGTLPVELLRCQSPTELRARLGSTRPVSAALVDSSVQGLDRDLLDVAGGCPVIVVGGAATRPWMDLGAAALLDRDFDPSALLDALASAAQPVAATDDVPGDLAVMDDSPLLQGRLIAVCGTGGTGASTCAIALGQGIAQGSGGAWLSGPVVVADLCRRGDLAMLHDAREILVGVQELVEAHRAERPTPHHVRSHCLPVMERGYDLLLGLRQPRAWTALRPRAVAASIKGLRSSYSSVVVDVEADFEGEAETGSIDVEERHAMSRCSVLSADAVLAIGGPGLQGTHSLIRLVRELIGIGVSAGRIVPVVNRAPRRAGSRAEITKAVGQLCANPSGLPAPPLFLPERVVDEPFRTGGRVPASFSSPIAVATAAVVERLPLLTTGPDPFSAPRRVRSGSLGPIASESDQW